MPKTSVSISISRFLRQDHGLYFESDHEDVTLSSGDNLDQVILIDPRGTHPSSVLPDAPGEPQNVRRRLGHRLYY